MFAQLEKSLGLGVGAITLVAAVVVVAQLHKSLVGVSRSISAMINSRAERSNDSDKPPEST